MAGDGSNGSCGVDDRIAQKVQTQLGFLALSYKQWAVGHVGITRPCLRFDSAASGPGNYECQGCNKNSRELAAQVGAADD